MESSNMLAAADKASTLKHMITGIHVGKIIDVYDGDTCRLALVFPDLQNPTTFKCEYIQIRMLGYDAPEMKKAHRVFGLEVRDVLRSLILDRIVIAELPHPSTLTSKRADPYGRVLGRLYTTSVLSTEQAIHMVRDKAIPVPKTHNVHPTPDELKNMRTGSPWKGQYLCVNRWMVDNLPLHAYYGQGARRDYTPEELVARAVQL